MAQSIKHHVSFGLQLTAEASEELVGYSRDDTGSVVSSLSSAKVFSTAMALVKLMKYGFLPRHGVFDRDTTIRPSERIAMKGWIEHLEKQKLPHLEFINGYLGIAYLRQTRFL